MLFTFPSRYWFAIGLSLVFSLAGWSRRIHAGFHVSRATQDTAVLRIASCTQLSCSVAPLSRGFHSRCFLHSRGPTTPTGPEPRRFGLVPGRSPLLGESRLFSLPPGTKMFQFPGFASPTSFRRWPVCNRPGCPIRKSADQWPFAPTRGLSQLVTSFIACESLGIRRTPFLAFSYLRLPVKAASVFSLSILSARRFVMCAFTHTRNATP